MSTLDRLSELCTALNRSNSSTAKLDVLKNFPDCQQLLKYTHDVILYQYGVTSKNIKKLEPKFAGKLTTLPFIDIESLLIALNNRQLTGHNAVMAILGFISFNPQHRELIFNILDRNLKTRTGITLINKVFPKLISEFDVALAESIQDYDPDRTKINFETQVWYASRKMDGLRCPILIDGNGDIVCKSRAGNEFLTLGVLKEQVRSLNLRNVVLDGEICILDVNGNEDFQGIMKLIHKKDFTIPNPRFKAFDIISMADFESKTSTHTTDERYQWLNTYNGSIPALSVLEQRRMRSWADVDEMNRIAAENGWEGIILRRGDKVYDGTRSSDIIKVKEFITAEYVVSDVVNGPIRYIDYRDDGSSFEREEIMLSRVTVIHKGFPVGVGSGFSLEQRKEFYANPSKIKGHTITIKYFEETNNQEEGISLRFTSLVSVHGTERIV